MKLRASQAVKLKESRVKLTANQVRSTARQVLKLMVGRVLKPVMKQALEAAVLLVSWRVVPASKNLLEPSASTIV